MSSSSSSINQYGINLVTNGTFTGSATGWSLSGGAFYADNRVKIPSTGSVIKSISQPIQVTVRRNYLVNFELTVDANKSVSVTVQFCGTTYSFGTFTAIGVDTTFILRRFFTAATVGSIKIFLTTGTTNSGSIDNVIVREWLTLSSSSRSSFSSLSSPSESSSSLIVRSTSSRSSGSSSLSSSSSESSESSSISSSSFSPSSVSSTSSSSSSSPSSSSSTVVLYPSSQSESSLLFYSSSSSLSSSISSGSSSSKSVPSSSSRSSKSSLSSTSSSSSSWSSKSSSSTQIRSTSSSHSLSSQSLSSYSSSPSSSTVVAHSSSSLSSSSTEVSETSSSTSLSSSYSSLSSGHNGWLNLPFCIEPKKDQSILCLCRHGCAIYAGTANQKVLQSETGADWGEFPHNHSIDDDRISSLFSYGNNLYIGTGSCGKIYTKNFSSGEFSFLYQTSDKSVRSFSFFNSKIFAGTYPSGIVYSFDGTTWRNEFKAPGGVTQLVSTSSNLFVFLDNSETAIVYDGSGWESMSIGSPPLDNSLIKIGSSAVNSGEQNHTIASFRAVSAEPVTSAGYLFLNRSKLGSIPLAIDNGDIYDTEKEIALPTRRSFGIHCAALWGEDLVFGGDQNTVFLYRGTLLRRLFDAALPISCIGVLNENEIIVAAQNRVFVANRPSPSSLTNPTG